ncbi:hypothetical protein GCM10007358_15430 [Phocicoccus schoeneichii]|uniref:Uncharacterized protein n=1 Tax=Phocicoccus schoeneichii TaxID=1812261 RepID=A0A6V7R0D4_9BACL|nr:hypothetical protein [Jeotgalicoccus schoeneichii]GGH54750.1 hypothetical protein GCM10007358_15430 [Jeotgalicoccus schoeneichii]CAD2070483.1 hypothetical protein JEOSCH030_00006 [Jeotgalicoccus schoeneichii]
MKNKKSYIFTLVALVFFIICLPSVASANEEVSSDEIDSIINELIDDVNSQLEEGKTYIKSSTTVPGTDEIMEIIVEGNSKIFDNKKQLSTYVAPSGIKNYSVTIRSLNTSKLPGFSYTFKGSFTYKNGKVTAYTKNNLNSGISYSHTVVQSRVHYLDPSVLQLSSDVQHKW